MIENKESYTPEEVAKMINFAYKLGRDNCLVLNDMFVTDQSHRWKLRAYSLSINAFEAQVPENIWGKSDINPKTLRESELIKKLETRGED